MKSPQRSSSPTDRSRLEQIFLLCADASPDLWPGLLQFHCADDPNLAAQVLRMLETDNRATDWSSPIWSAQPLRFGQYRVTGRIGAGGMGIVYSAVRDDAEFDKSVAIKAIPPGLITPQGIKLLRQERQILAQLEHPNIARLLDGGSTNEGVPYLVMEHVEGLPLLEFARRETLSETSRLQLFLGICEGVAYAHRNLIIHRDLKPANILVTADGTPKLLDFGIARLLDLHADVTVVHERSMTLDYASPEQLLGRRMTTESDVYSLGLVLTALLAGKLPARDRADEEIADLLPGDLGRIARKALQNEPESRYRSVEAFAEDLRNYLEGRPVTARPATFLYRATRFLKRNRVAVLAGGVAAVAIASGLELRIEALKRAERRFNDVRKLANSLVFEISDAVENVPGTLVARRLIGKRAIEYLDSLTEEAGSETALKAELANAYLKVSPLAFDIPKELEINRKAVALQRSVVAAEKSNLKHRSDLAEALVAAANSERRIGEYANSLRDYREYLEINEYLARTEPAHRGYQEDLSGAYGEVATLLRELGRFREARELFSKSPPVIDRLLATGPRTPNLVFGQSTNLIFVARVEAELGNAREALDWNAKSMALSKEVLGLDPANRAYIRLYAFGLLNSARYKSDLNDDRAALSDLDQVTPMFDALAQADPADTGYQRTKAIAYLLRGQILSQMGKSAEALNCFAQAIAISEQLFAGDPRHVETTMDLLEIYDKTARLQVQSHNVAAAEKSVARALELIALREPLPRQQFLLADVANIYQTVGDVRIAERPNLYQKSLAIWQGLQTSGELLPRQQKRMGEVQAGLARVTVEPKGKEKANVRVPVATVP